MKKIDIKIDKKLFNDAYLPYLFDYSHRYNVYYGGRSSGKSYFICDKLIIKCVNDKRRMLWLMKEGNKVESTIWQLAMDSLIKFKIYDKVKINLSKSTIEFPNGSWIKMIGLKNSEDVKAYVNIDTIWAEETSNFNASDIDIIDGTIRGKKKFKELYFSFNPVSKANFVYSYFGFDTGIVPEDTFILKTTYRDNKFCDESTIKRLERLKTKNFARWKIESEGEFATLDKLVYSYTVEEFNYKEILKQPNTMAIFGLDFGYINDNSALVCGIVDNLNMKLYLYDEFFRKGMLNNEIAQMIKDKGYSKEVIIADSAERKSIDELKKLGITRIKPARKGHGSIMNGVQRINQYELIVHPSCSNIQDELDNYSYQKDKVTGEYINKPIDSWNHGLDALRYAIQSVKKKAKILTVKL